MNNLQKLNIEKYLDGDLSEQELIAFLEELREDRELIHELNLAMEIKGLLFTSQRPKFHALEEEVMNHLESDTSSMEDQIMEKLPEPKVHKFPVWFKRAVAAQIILIPILFFILTPAKIQEAPPVLIGHVHKVGFDSFVLRGTEKVNIRKGDPLYSKDQIYVQNESSLGMKYLDGSTLKFSSQSFVRLSETEGQKRVELFSGVLDADIAKQPPGKDMIITTEHSECEVIGTQFTLSSSNVSSLLDVTEGAVRYNKIKSDKSVMVEADHYASASQDESLELNKNTKPLYKSPLVTYFTPGKTTSIEVELHGARSLYLVVSNGDNGISHDHSAWIDPKIIGPAGELSLTELPMKIAKAGYAEVEVNGGIYGGPLRVNGVDHPIGIAAHATSVIAWDIPPGYNTFVADGVILDSANQRNNPKHHESVQFEVYTAIPEKKLKGLLIRKRRF
ncbi:NPCBM/NEW2 domain-containing protein [Lentisphaera profundi]|uniref:NPCBM/NEW2 domain-containing protein n=1 Tax=Lentisphaera profundi TaxID=1658616 RepID=A0ABY7VWQ7_9BACT|nr:NPCBM/NEW2 domain-containing protein [Lentisphaera profundi]WDE98341.1 NPCBM/NEW2 domain-containing protein [Lentisphaera profundi]